MITKDVEGYPNYTISEDLIVRKKGYLPPYKYAKAVEDKEMAQVLKGGYLLVNLVNERGEKKQVRVHRIIATAFIPNPLNLPQVNHLSGDKLDNRPNNLAWCTAAENSRHAREVLEVGLPKPKKEKPFVSLNRGRVQVNQLTKDGVFIKTHAGVKDAARELRISSATIWSSLTGKGTYKCKVGGKQFRWEYTSENTQQKNERRRKEMEAEEAAIPKPIIKLDLEGNFIEAYHNMKKAADSVGGVNVMIAATIKGEYKTYKGYRWEKRET